MSAIPVETIEPDPAATSISNDETVNQNGSDSAAPTTTEDAVVDANAVKEETSNEKNGSSENKYRHSQYEKRKLNRRNESKFDPTALPTTDDPVKIRAQVEFYFGDANLPTDKFMWELTDGATNLPVSVAKIHSFKRMQRFQPYSAVVAALKDSEFLEVVGPEGSEEVKRKTPYDPKSRLGHKSESRSIYVKGFGDEEPTTQFDIEAFFTPYGPINSVRLRRTEDKLFKGSVFVEFADDELAEKFLALESKPLWQGKNDLKIISKREYIAGKEQDIKDGKLEPSQTRPFRGGRGGRGGSRGGRDGDRDPNDWKKRREHDQKNGFKDRRGGRGGRGGRGRGNRDRDDRGPRNDRNREREDKADDKQETAGGEQNDKKRARDDEGGDQAPAAKKVDAKTETPVEASS
ncbi:hypothetical protein BP5796_01448 [Coleophoma crateriformis]|uniref:Uncharacterized protein n=1 Tax=Coleophoma crateriformis TaxID=565419 RepID=A0A3D8T0I9_9HELO|nr:hypothetical protein BP5796_01448 [Coleophoma crateriformis]